MVKIDRLHFLNKAHHGPSCSQAQGGAGTLDIIDLCDNHSSTSSGVDTEPTDTVTATVFLKVLNPCTEYKANFDHAHPSRFST